jgi:hypothetical protein
VKVELYAVLFLASDGGVPKAQFPQSKPDIPSGYDVESVRKTL